MQKDDEIWELKPGEGSGEPSGEDKGSGEKETDSPEAGGAEAPKDKDVSEAGGKLEEGEKKKEPGRIDMDEILDLKPDEEGGGKSEGGGKKEDLELVDIGDKKAEGEPESAVSARKEEKSVDMEKPQVLEPDEKKDKKGPAPELQGGEGKKYEKRPAVQETAAPAKKNRLLTIGLFVVFLLLAGSAALLALPFFGIETIPDDIPVAGHIIEFYRNLPIFPD